MDHKDDHPLPGMFSELRDSIFRHYFDSIPDIALLVDREYRIVDFNPAAKEKCPSDLSTGKHCYEVFYARETPCEKCPAAPALRGENASSLQRFDNHFGWCESVSFPIRDRQSGEVLGATLFLRDMNHRFDAERALKRSENLLTEVFGAIQDSLYVIDPEFNVLHVNPRMEAIFPEHHPIVGKKCYTLVSNTDVCEDCPAARVLASGTMESQTKIHYYPHEPGEPWEQGISGDWRELIVYPIADRESPEKIASILCFVRDITKQKMAETALEHYRSYLAVIADIRRTFFDFSEEECVRVLLDSVTKYFKIDFARYVEVERGTVTKSFLHVSASHYELSLQESSQEAMEFLRGPLHESTLKAIRRNEIHLFRRGEPGFPLEKLPIDESGICIRSVLIVPFFENEGKQIALIFFARRNSFFDDTIISYLDSSVKELKRIIEESTRWKQQQERLRHAKEKAETAMMVKSQFLANMSHEIRTPMTAILGFTDLALTDYILPLYRLLQQQDEQNVLNVDQKPPMLADRKEYENLLERCIGAIKTIQSNGEFLLAMINDILDFSKVDMGRMNLEIIPVDLLSMLEELYPMYTIESKRKNIAFLIEARNAIPRRILSDYVRLKQVLVNLLGNAMKFTHNGSVRLEFSWEPSQSTDTRTAAPAFSTGDFDSASPAHEAGRLRIDVQDSGIGIDQKHLSAIFQPFRQGDSSTTRRFGGTGLGLAITKKIIDLMSGTISVASEVDQGTCFTVEIPIFVQADPETIPQGDIRTLLKNASPLESDRLGGVASKELLKNVRVLLVEDGLDNRRLFVAILKNAGAQITEAEHGEIAVTLAMEEYRKNTPFDVVLMDMQMPTMDGYTATTLLREQGYPGPIIALTAHAMHEDRQKCLDIGCNDYMTKPILREELIDCIRRAKNHGDGG